MKKTILLPLVGILILAVAGTALILQGSDEPSAGAQVASLSAGEAAQSGDADIVVYKSPTCGCCTGWVDHMRENGFSVEAVDVDYETLHEARTRAGVPRDLGSCHTAMADGYAIEGHVPAGVVRRMLEQRPEVAGISVPGMPTGSPGMEGPNPQPYDVIAFDRDGERVVYESVYPGQPSSETR